MLVLRDASKIQLYNQPVDMRKSIDGLSLLVVEALECSPQSGDVYLFRNRMGDKVKALVWDRNGFILHYKRMEKSKFKFPKKLRDAPLELTEQQLSWFFAGLEFDLMSEFSELNFDNYF